MNGPLIFRRSLRSLASGSIASLAALAMCFHAAPVQADAACAKLSDVEIVQLLNRWRAEFASGDPARVSALYAEDATLTASKGNLQKGNEAIRSYYKDLLAKHPMTSIRPSSLTSDCGAATVGGPVVYRLSGERKGTRTLLGGTYSIEYALRGDRWMIVRHFLAAEPRGAVNPKGGAASKTPPL
jgi:uncharacterized protein (TIGR02246 family)